MNRVSDNGFPNMLLRIPIAATICCFAFCFGAHAQNIDNNSTEKLPFILYQEKVFVDGVNGRLPCPKIPTEILRSLLYLRLNQSVIKIVPILDAPDLSLDEAFSEVQAALPKQPGSFEALDYWLCMEFGNGRIKHSTHQRFIEMIKKKFIGRELDVVQTARDFDSNKPDRRIVNIAIIRGGETAYLVDSIAGFVNRTKTLLRANGYFPRIEYAQGSAEIGKDHENKRVFDELISRFEPKGPDYLVTIGTQISQYARRKFLNKIPIIFINVTDPIESSLVRRAKGLDPDIDRGNIAGVQHALDHEKRLKLIRKAFPTQRLGFIYSSSLSVDVIVRKKLESLTKQFDFNFVPIEISGLTLSPEQFKSADVFFGWDYLDRNFFRLAHVLKKPLIGIDEYDCGVAVITTWLNEYDLGQIAAEKILFQHLLIGLSLQDLPIEAPDAMKIAVNISKAKEFQIDIPTSIVSEADEVLR